MPNRARAYVEQARSDYDAYVASGFAAEPVLGEHHRLQLPQMAVEKLAKAFLYHAEPQARYSHHVVVPALNRIRSHTVADAAGLRLATLVRLLDAAKPVLLQIEAASPSVGYDGRGLTRDEWERTANVEYPWQRDPADPTSWVAPAAHVFGIAADLHSRPKHIATVRRLDRLMLAADAIVPVP